MVNKNAKTHLFENVFTYYNNSKFLGNFTSSFQVWYVMLKASKVCIVSRCSWQKSKIISQRSWVQQSLGTERCSLSSLQLLNHNITAGISVPLSCSFLVSSVNCVIYFLYNKHLLTDKNLAPVVRRLDDAIQWINYYSADSVVCFVNTSSLDSNFSVG